MSLKEYRRKREFNRTPEPEGNATSSRGTDRSDLPQFVIQKHAATRLHYDFRLEHEGTLKSWAVPHGPSLDPTVKSLAVQVEDHPLDYAQFEGTIPKGQYGGGTVMVWDRGTWESEDVDISAALLRGKISFQLQGEKLRGGWTLVRMRGRESENWLLIKKKDAFSAGRKQKDILAEQPRSALTDRDLSQIANGETASRRKRTVQPKSKAKPTATTSNTKMLKLLRSATRTNMPAQLQPQLATLSKAIPGGDQWLHEIKLDGYRVLARLDEGHVTLMTRSGLDWTRRFPKIASALSKLKVKQAWLDGEIVAEEPNGISNFQRLQNALAENVDHGLIYYVFDLPWAEGHDLSQLGLIERKGILQQLLAQSSRTSTQKAKGQTVQLVRFHDHIVGRGDRTFASACDLKLEGIISKRADSPYEFRRTDTWLKNKCQHEQEFVIAGYTKPAGERTGFGALLLGYYHDDQLVYCGRVGTGFSESSLKELSRALKSLESDTCPYTTRPTVAQRRGVTWVAPKLVAEVSFVARTNDGILRHAVFHGLREDKPANEVSLEKQMMTTPKKVSQTKVRSAAAVEPAKTRTRSRRPSSSSVEVTHPDRLVYEDPPISKANLVQFLADIGQWLMPGIVGRPLTMLRCPQGVSHHCFYQKHFDEKLPKGIGGITIREKTDDTTYAVVKDVDGLIALAQLNVIEFHPWPAQAKGVEKPDRLIFDLDPGEGAAWSAVVDGAFEVRKLLQQVNIESFVRTSGGKGLHVVAPINAGSVTWEELKAFAKLLSQTMNRQYPKQYVATISKAARRGKVFVDYLRNQRGATAVASYSPRARPGAGVAMPLRWQDLSSEVTNDDFTVPTVASYLKKRRGDPWKGFNELEQSLPELK